MRPVFLGPVLPAAADRRLHERVLVRLPFLAGVLAGALNRLPPGNSLRRRGVREMFRLAWDGINRNDFEPALLVYESDVEVHVHGAVGVGFADSYSGKRGWLDLFDDMFEAFDDPHFEVLRVHDGGDRVVAEVLLTANGKLSGAPVRDSTTNVYHLSPRGKVVRQEIFWIDDSWDAALAAAGLSG